MAKLTELKTSKLLRVFVMGDAGTWKTVGASTFPKPIIFDFDGKVSSAHSFWSKHDPKKLEEIEFEDCSPKDDKGTSFKKMNDLIGKIKQEYQKTGELPYETCVIDSATIMSTELLNWLVNFETGIARNTKIKSRKVACMQDYMILAPTLSDFIFEVFNLPWNVVMTGHIQIQQDELTGAIERMPMIPGQMAKKIPIIFPEVYVSMAKGDKCIVQTKADFKYPCRSQIQGLPKEIEFNYENLTKAY